MIKRPHCCEAESDLLVSQKDFFKKKDKCSVTLHQKQTHEGGVGERHGNPSLRFCDNHVCLKEEFKVIGSVKEEFKVIGSVKEKSFKSSQFISGFPQVPLLASDCIKTMKSTNKSEKRSLFARNFSRFKDNEDFGKVNICISNSRENIANQSHDGNEWNVCNEQSKYIENIEKLNAMTEEEILDEKKKLEGSLDPKIISFLKSKNYPKAEAFFDENHQKDLLPGLRNSEIGDHFDNNGCFIQQTENPLHHCAVKGHCSDHTLPQLFQMTRSVVPAHRIFGLNSVNKILINSLTQSATLHFEILEQCLNAGLIFVLRWAMDEHSEQIYSTAIETLANILYSKNEQEFLNDLIYTEFGCNVPQLCIYYKKKLESMTKEELEEDRDLTDAEMIKIDMIKGLRQMSILPRLRYIIHVCKPSSVTMQNCLRILTRIAQHDQNSAFELVECPHLLQVLCQLLQQSLNDAVEISLYNLLRVLCQANKDIALKVISLVNFKDVISKALAHKPCFTDTAQTNLFRSKLQLWRVLLLYGIAKNWEPALAINMISYASDKVFASLIHVLHPSLTTKTVQDSLFDECFVRLSNYTHDEKEMVGQQQCITALIAHVASYFEINYTSTPSLDLLETAEKVWKTTTSLFITSTLFQKLLNEIRSSSFFSASPAPNPLPSLPMYGVPYPSQPNCVPQSSLLSAYFKLLRILVKFRLFDEIYLILASPVLLSYMEFVLHNGSTMISMLGANIECFFILHAVNIFTTLVKKNAFELFVPGVVDVYLQMASFLLSFPHHATEKRSKRIFKHLLFNDKVVSYRETGRSEDKLKQIVQIYVEELQIGEPTGNESFFHTRTACLPVDWMFYPLLNLYEQSRKVEYEGRVIEKAKDEVLHRLRCCLRYILNIEKMHPSILFKVTKTLRVTRLMCVYLTEGSVFNEPSLKEVLTSLVTCYASRTFQEQVTFSKEVTGIISFYDFYVNFVEQYLSSSYGDVNFANLLLMPMQLQHDVRFRKAVWTEFADIFKMFPIAIAQVVYDMQSFLCKCDFEMLDVYFKCLVTETVTCRCPFFYLVAVHHVAQFIFMSKNHNNRRVNMLKAILNHRNKLLREHVMLYCSFEASNPRGFSLFDHLPPTRQQLFEEATS